MIGNDLLFKALADPTRRAIFEHLCREGEQTVARLTSHAGISQPAVSKHIGLLKGAKLIRYRRQGRETHYSAEPGGLMPLASWATAMIHFWESRFDDLEILLKRMD